MKMSLAEKLVDLLRDTHGDYVKVYAGNRYQPSEFQFQCLECEELDEDHKEECWAGKTENWINEHWDKINDN